MQLNVPAALFSIYPYISFSQRLFVASVCLLLLLGHPCSGDKDLKSAAEDMALNEVAAPEEPTAQQTRVHVDVRHPNGGKVASATHKHEHRFPPSGHTDDSHPSSTRVSHLHPSSATHRHSSGRQTRLRAQHSGSYGYYPRRPTVSYPYRLHQLSGSYDVSPKYSPVSRPHGLYTSYGHPRSYYPATGFRKSYRPDNPFSAALPRPNMPFSATALPSTPLSTIHPVAPFASLPISPFSDLPRPDLPPVGVSRPFSPQLPEDALINQVDVRVNPNDPFVDSVSQAISPNNFAFPRDLFRDPITFVYPESPFVNLNGLVSPRDAHFNVNHDLSPAGSTYDTQEIPFVNQYDPSISTFDGSFVNRQPFSPLEGPFLIQGASPFGNNDNVLVNLNTPVVERDSRLINQGAASSYNNIYTSYIPINNQGSTFRDQPFVDQVSPSNVNPYTSYNAFNPFVNQGVRTFKNRYPFLDQNNIVNQGVDSFDAQVLHADEDDSIIQEVQLLDDPLNAPVATAPLANPSSTFVNQIYSYPLMFPYSTSSHLARGGSYGKYYTKNYNHF